VTLDGLMLGGEAWYLSGSEAEPFPVKCQITWLGCVAVRVVDVIGVRFLERRHVFPSKESALGSIRGAA
jgi:hypothetical protein